MKYWGKSWGQLAMFAAFAAMCTAPQAASARGYKAVDGSFGGIVAGKVSFEGALPAFAIEQIPITKAAWCSRFPISQARPLRGIQMALRHLEPLLPLTAIAWAQAFALMTRTAIPAYY